MGVLFFFACSKTCLILFLFQKVTDRFIVSKACLFELDLKRKRNIV